MEDMWGVESLGHARQKVEVSPGIYQYKDVYVIRPIMGPVGKKHKTIKVRVTGRVGNYTFNAGNIIVERDPSLG